MYKSIFFSSLIALLLQGQVLAQKGYQKINQAKKEIEQGKFAKAKRHLHTAENSDYGFCGNAWMDARSEINQCYFKLYVLEGNMAEAGEVLENMDDWGYPPISDSAALSLYIQQFGGDRILKSIDAGLAKAKAKGDMDQIVEITLENEFKLILPTPWNDALDAPIISGLDENGFRQAYTSYFHQSGLHQMLTQPSAPKSGPIHR